MVKFYITTPIYYVNDVASIGHAYTTIAADVLARWHRLLGDDVFFLAGLDENSQKTVAAAKKLGVKDIKAYTDTMAKKWQQTWKALEISNDDFIRTTEERHKKIVEAFFMKVVGNGDIYKGNYEGLYCDGCEDFVKESDLVQEKCPYHKTEPNNISEENYFFKLSRYQKQVLDHIRKNKEFVGPTSRRNEVVSFIEQGLKDISISRPNVEWGIPLPIDKKHFFWVWYDALLNYISGAPKYWPAQVQLMGKDIIKFHCIIFPAMLLSAGYKLPKKMFAHGFLTINGQKMSKSLGNAIDPLLLSEQYGVDTLRYFLIREIPFGEDGDFSEEKLKNRLNNELNNDLGNLVSRVLTLTEKNFKELKKAALDKTLTTYFDLQKIKNHIDTLELHNALSEIWKFVHAANRYINEQKPWECQGATLQKQLYTLLESLRVLSIVLQPFIPSTTEKITKQLGIKAGTFKDCTFGKVAVYKVKKGDNLFQKIP